MEDGVLAKYEWSWDETSTPIQPLTHKVHPLYIISNNIIEHIDDYPTLICLALSCRTFYTNIFQHQSKLKTTFLNLEKGVPATTTTTTNNNDTDNPIGPRERFPRLSSHFCGCSPILECRDKPYHQRFNIIPFEKRPDGTFVAGYDILRHNTGQLPSLDWLPCYGCMRIRRRETQFFEVHRRDCRELLGCDALTRRCVFCNVDAECWLPCFPLRYLQDMPRGYTGYRLRCSMCRTVEWSVRRPRRRQELMKLCFACFEGHLAREDVAVVLSREWRVLVNMPFQPAKSKRVSLRIAGVDADEEGGENVDGWSDQSNRWPSFEILKLEG